MFKTVVAAGCLLVCSVNASAVNKCTDPKTGQVTYSDAPCATGAVNAPTPHLRSNMAEGNPEGERRLRQEVQRSAHIRSFVERGQVIPGMTETELVAAWGRPSTINSSVYASGTSDQWVYRREGNGVQYVYTNNGVVTAVQNRPDEPGLRSQGAPGGGRGCYSEQAIRNAQTSATSILLSEQQRREALDRIALMRPC